MATQRLRQELLREGLEFLEQHHIRVMEVRTPVVIPYIEVSPPLIGIRYNIGSPDFTILPRRTTADELALRIIRKAGTLVRMSQSICKVESLATGQDIQVFIGKDQLTIEAVEIIRRQYPQIVSQGIGL